MLTDQPQSSLELAILRTKRTRTNKQRSKQSDGVDPRRQENSDKYRF